VPGERDGIRDQRRRRGDRVRRLGPREGLRAAVRFGFNPKKSGPDHAVPVIFRAKSLKQRR
jgi:hypothetical protein